MFAEVFGSGGYGESLSQSLKIFMYLNIPVSDCDFYYIGGKMKEGIC